MDFYSLLRKPWNIWNSDLCPTQIQLPHHWFASIAWRRNIQQRNARITQLHCSKLFTAESGGFTYLFIHAYIYIFWEHSVKYSSEFLSHEVFHKVIQRTKKLCSDSSRPRYIRGIDHSLSEPLARWEAQRCLRQNDWVFVLFLASKQIKEISIDQPRDVNI